MKVTRESMHILAQNVASIARYARFWQVDKISGIELKTH